MPYTSPARAQAILGNLATVTSSGGISDIACAGNTIYVGGNFTQMGRWSGSGVPVSTASGVPIEGYPQVDGAVSVVVSDGRRGWFIGGDFLVVGGVPRRFLAHILPDGSVSGWNPLLDAPVKALCLAGDTLFVGGSFTSCSGVSRLHGAAYDVRTGRLTPWDPRANAPIEAVATGDTVVYLGGRFSALDTLQRGFLAAVDRKTGRATNWAPGADSTVLALLVYEAEVYAAGCFRHVSGEARSSMAALDRQSGMVRPWSWPIATTGAALEGGTSVGTMATDGVRLYFGGSFTSVGGLPRAGAAAITLSSHEVSSWSPSLVGPSPGPVCRSMSVSRGIVYFGGLFSGAQGAARLFAAAFDTSGHVTEWNPRPNAEVRCVAAEGLQAYLGGDFVSVKDWQSRRFLAALDASSGDVLPWDPDPDNVVGQIRVSGNTVYVAGAFEAIGGQPRRCLAAIDAVTGQPTSWNPGVEGDIYPPVMDMCVQRGVVYVAGLFTGLGGQPRFCLGAVDSVTGQATPWNPVVDDFVQSIEGTGDTLYLGGWFTHVGGESRHYLAALDTSGTLLDWNPDPDDVVHAMAVTGNRVFIAGFFSQVGGLHRSELAAIDRTTGNVAEWVADANPQVRCLAVAHDVLYAGGWFTQIGGSARSGLAALDTETGELLSWAPQPNGAVFAVRPFNDALLVGGAFDHLGPTLRTGLASVALARGGGQGPFPRAGQLLAVAQCAPNPVRTSAIIRFGLSASARVSLSIFDLAGRCMAMPIGRSKTPSGYHQIEVDAASWPAGVYYCRLEADGETAVRKMVVLR